VEGVGDHACEYMTGGVAVILGEIGINFGAGMTGGTAWVLDEEQTIVTRGRYHADFLEARPYAESPVEEQAALRSLIEEHVRLSQSVLGQRLLDEWAEAAENFVLFVPKPQA
jgi:glutamate synthase (NADPH/NADH) large chain